MLYVFVLQQVKANKQPPPGKHTMYEIGIKFALSDLEVDINIY